MLLSGNCFPSVPVAARYKAWVFDRLLARIAGSNPAGDKVVCLWRMLWVVQAEISAMGRSLAQRSPTKCMCMSFIVIMCNSNLLRLQWIGKRGQIKRENSGSFLERFPFIISNKKSVWLLLAIGFRQFVTPFPCFPV